LLSPAKEGAAKLAIKRDANGAVLVDGARIVEAASAEELSAIFKSGLEGRKTAATKMNSEVIPRAPPKVTKKNKSDSIV
jgi:hypothetical protein